MADKRQLMSLDEVLPPADLDATSRHAFLVAATIPSTSSTVLKHAKLTRVVPLTPKRSISGWVQWWPVRTAMPC